jgi:hypothetical protein
MRVMGNCTSPLTDRRRRCSPRDPSASLRRTGWRQDARVSFAFTIVIAHTFWKKSASLRRWNKIRANLAQQLSLQPAARNFGYSYAIIRFSRWGHKIKYSKQINCAVKENLEKICQVGVDAVPIWSRLRIPRKRDSTILEFVLRTFWDCKLGSILSRQENGKPATAGKSVIFVGMRLSFFVEKMYRTVVL